MNKTYLTLQDRTDFREGEEQSIMGYYKVIIPTEIIEGISIKEEDYMIIKRVKDSLSKDIKRIETDGETVTVDCYKGEGVFVYDIESIYLLKDEIENRVKIAMHEAAIFRYTLEIEIGTLF